MSARRAASAGRRATKRAIRRLVTDASMSASPAAASPDPREQLLGRSTLEHEPARPALEHYFDMAWIALAMPITAGVAALGIRGWRFSAGCAALAGAIFGIAAVLYPGQESSPGAGWGAVAIVWAVTLAAVTWLAEPVAEPAPSAA